MSDAVAEAPFKSAAEQVEAAHEEAVTELKSSVAKSKAAALKKVRP